MDSYLFCDRFDWRNKNREFGTCERWHHLHRNLEFKYIKISKFWKSGQLSVRCLHSRSSVGLGRRVLVSLCLFIDPHRFSLSLLLLYAVCTSNNKWLFIVDGEVLFLSCQHPGNFVSTDHPDYQKKFRMDCVIPCQWIFQTQRYPRLQSPTLLTNYIWSDFSEDCPDIIWTS